ncbi:MAG: response regulator [candidate division NC10 bacterium]|nr:response regulator [candidate division NC10 bacterium]
MGTVLVIDANPLVQKLCTDILRGCNHQVHLAAEAKEGLERLRELSIDVILLDMASPGPGGLEALKAVREQAPQVPVIIITAYPTSRNAIEALKLGAYDFIGKAILREELINAVEKAVERHALDLENQKLLQELKQKVETLSALYEVGKALTSTLDLEQVLPLVMEKAQELLGAEASSLLLIDPGTGELAFQVALGKKGSVVRELRLKKGEGIAGWVALQGRSALVNDVHQDPRFCRAVDERTEFTTRSLVCVPLLAREQVIGVIEVINRRDGRPFEERDLELLNSLAAQATLAILNARHYQIQRQISTKLRELDRLKDELVARVIEELRGLLAHVLGYAELLGSKEAWDEATRREFISGIQEEGCRIQRLVEEFLDFGKLDELGAGD